MIGRTLREAPPASDARRTVLPLVSSVLVVWSGLALAALPVAMGLGRAAARGDADGLRQYEALRPAAPLAA